MDTIVEAASALVEEKGYNNFSVRELAMRLHVKAASLYNHVSSVADINRAVGIHAANQLNEALERATAGKAKDEALISLAHEYRSFVKNQYELYRSIIGLLALDQDAGLTQIGRDSLMVVAKVVRLYHMKEEDSVNFSRCFRAALHGYATFEMAGYFTERKMKSDDSFDFMVQGYVDWANQLAGQPAES